MPYFLQRLPCFVSTLLFATVCLAQPLPPSELSLEQIPEPIRYNISAADWQLFQAEPERFRSDPPSPLLALLEDVQWEGSRIETLEDGLVSAVRDLIEERFGRALLLMIDDLEAPDAQRFQVDHLVEHARAGNLLAQAVLTVRIEGYASRVSGKAQLTWGPDCAACVLADRWLQGLAVAHPNPEQETARRFLAAVNARLANRHRVEEPDWPQIRQMLSWLLTAIRLAPDRGVYEAEIWLAERSELPPINLRPWNDGSDPTPARPEPGTLRDCNHLLGEPEAILERFELLQARLLAGDFDAPDGRKGAAALAQAELADLLGHGEELVTLIFADIAAASLFEVIASASGAPIHIPEGVELPRLTLVALRNPIGLIHAQLAEALELDQRCDQAAIWLSPRSPQAERSRVILRAGFVESITPAELAQGRGEGELRWTDQGHYRGLIEAGQPAGHGSFLIAEHMRLEGEFRHRRLEGQAFLRAGQWVVQEGEYRGGVLHGEGRHIDPFEGVEWIGHFDGGRFNGTGRERLRGNFRDGTLLSWQGPYRDGRKHGPGRCLGPELDYPCEYRDGLLVAVDGLELSVAE